MSLSVLQICPKMPFPPVDGGCIASNNITSGLLKQGHRVKVMALSTPKHPADPALADERYVRQTELETCFVDTTLRPVEALRHLFSKRSYNIERFYSRAFEEMLVSRLARDHFDVVHFESAYTAPYLPAVRRVSPAVAVLRAHNVEYEIWGGTEALEKNPLKRAYIGHLARRMEQFERRIVRRFDGIAAITEADRRTFLDMACPAPVETIPFGVDLGAVTSELRPEALSVFHLGSMDWLPNQDGIRWFLDEVWPGVHARFNEVTLYLAGRSMPGWLMEIARPNVVVLGEVESAYDFMASKSIMVVPLHSGGGMRIKIVEGLALQKAIVSTTLGAAGIDYRDGEHLLIADTADAFREKLCRLLEDAALRARIAALGQRLAREAYDNDAVTSKLVRLYDTLLGTRPMGDVVKP
jgi:polysaccharide biosynthesis protein PslH